jgi:hypothetical protein
MRKKGDMVNTGMVQTQKSPAPNGSRASILIISIQYYTEKLSPQAQVRLALGLLK